MNEISVAQNAFELQRQHRWTQSQTTASERIALLKSLKKNIIAIEVELKTAMFADFAKPAAEVELTEVFPALEEINFVIENLHNWMAPHSVPTPIALMGTRSEIHYEARGHVLIMAPWNYPFMLSIAPLITALAAGNVCLLRPSEKTPNTSRVLRKLIETTFEPKVVALVEGGFETADALLELPFDHIFFTGSTQIGRKVMAAAAKHLASVTLELGGKSPTVVHEDASIENAAKRIVWSKYLNAGQTCIAPDYIFVHEKIAENFITAVKNRINEVFEGNSEQSDSFARLVDSRAFSRVKALLDQSIAAGAKLETSGAASDAKKFLAPTVLTQVKPNHAIMSEEIFGPVMPIMTYTSLDEVIDFIRSKDKPLALYVYTNSSKVANTLIRSTSAGGTVVNNGLIHLANPHLPFGGVGASGMGNYHGFFGFRTFSHERSVVFQGRLAIADFLFPPYGRKLFQLTLRFLRLLSR
jgi:aldehyde dehydrogenase (NAD+)